MNKDYMILLMMVVCAVILVKLSGLYEGPERSAPPPELFPPPQEGCKPPEFIVVNLGDLTFHIPSDLRPDIYFPLGKRSAPENKYAYWSSCYVGLKSGFDAKGWSISFENSHLLGSDFIPGMNILLSLSNTPAASSGDGFDRLLERKRALEKEFMNSKGKKIRKINGKKFGYYRVVYDFPTPSTRPLLIDCISNEYTAPNGRFFGRLCTSLYVLSDQVQVVIRFNDAHLSDQQIRQVVLFLHEKVASYMVKK